MADDETTQKTLTDADITTGRITGGPQGRRGFLGLMAAGGLAAGAAVAIAPGEAQAQGTDADDGQWADRSRCGRGSGGYPTGVSDHDSGTAISDPDGHGRGAPYC